MSIGKNGKKCKSPRFLPTFFYIWGRILKTEGEKRGFLTLAVAARLNFFVFLFAVALCWQILWANHGKRGCEAVIKGSQKQMIVVRTGDSHYFDEAYFVLRREVDPSRSRGDILREANRILEESSFASGRDKRKHRRGWIFFAVGILCGCLLAAVIFALL